MSFLCQILLNLIIGAIGSLIASFIFIRYTRKRDKEIERRNYDDSVGTYTGFGPTTDGGSIVNLERPLSDVEITYLRGNLLQITVKEINDPHTWQGIISMESNHYGTIVWRYIKQHGQDTAEKQHLFGLKKFVFFPKDNKKVCYLMGNLQAGYFNEFLIEK